MAIEAINGAISYQAQTYVPPKPAVGSEAGTMEGAVQDISVNVDQTTAAVAKTQEYDSNGSDGGRQQSADAREGKEQLKKAIAELNKNSHNSQVQFGVHEDTNRITLKIVDKETKETIKEFPAEKTLDMIAKAWELAGLLVDEKR
ncbi:MAG: flagellar protein FlaG [bacterium]|nr:flagellar protein FlaG [bacterium]